MMMYAETSTGDINIDAMTFYTPHPDDITTLAEVLAAYNRGELAERTRDVITTLMHHDHH